jgi:aspartyl-tRNA synthetase
MKRNYCNQISLANLNQELVIYAWVKKVRKLGQLTFIEIADHTGRNQGIIENNVKFNREDVVKITGSVAMRNDVNQNVENGDVELKISAYEIVNESKTTPMIIEDETDALEEVRYRYRYLDLRRPNVQNIIRTRHQITKYFRNFLDDNDFIDIETPILSKSTPEGARDYLVPSRVNKGQFYALPQSPQVYKQLLMVSGFDRYYQIAKVFRDEDLRIDRQPEFTQIDLEMAFMSPNEIFELMEKLYVGLFKSIKPEVQLPKQFERMTYQVAMDEYGIDKPDTRFELKLNDITSIFKNSGFNAFASADYVGCLVLDKAQDYSSNKIKQLEKLVQTYGAKNLGFLKMKDQELTGPIAKFLDKEKEQLISQLNLTDDSIIFIIAGPKAKSQTALGQLRLNLGEQNGLIDKSKYNFLWITDWPLFEYDEELGRFFAAHHPFTAPVTPDFTNPHEMQAQAYDLVLNGFELGGGSVRITSPKVQMEMFKALGFTAEEAKSQFGELIEAYEYGAPNHAGIAFGLDRLVMLLTGTSNIKETIAFPKNLAARDVMFSSPTSVNSEQLDELGLSLVEEKEEDGKQAD